MTREAAVLGIPTATVYAGRRAAVELELERQGRISRISQPQQIDALMGSARNPVRLNDVRRQGALLTNLFLEAVLDTVDHSP